MIFFYIKLMSSLFNKYYPIEFKDDTKVYQFKNLAEIAIQETNYGCHIVGLIVDPKCRNNGYGKQIVEQYTGKYDKVTANVLFNETGNTKFWKKLNFKCVEVNKEEKYLVFEKISNSSYVNPKLFEDNFECISTIHVIKNEIRLIKKYFPLIFPILLFVFIFYYMFC
jgi:hypothetical protein